MVEPFLLHSVAAHFPHQIFWLLINVSGDGLGIWSNLNNL